MKNWEEYSIGLEEHACALKEHMWVCMHACVGGLVRGFKLVSVVMVDKN